MERTVLSISTGEKLLKLNTIKGGSSDNGPTANKFFSSENREAILNLFQNISDDERAALGMIKLLKLHFYFSEFTTLVKVLLMVYYKPGRSR